MTTATPGDWDRHARALLATDPPERALADYVAYVDTVHHQGGDGEAWAERVVTVSVVAAGEVLVAQRPEHANVRATLAAAAAYLARPSEATQLAYFHAATASYPFGVGEGCYSTLPVSEDHARPGSGCRSGSGTLACIAMEVGSAPVVDALRAAWRPPGG